MFSYLYHTLLYQPLFNLLIWFYNVIPGHDIGIAIILLTIFIKIILYPISWKAIRSQKVMQDLQPKLQELQKKHKDNKEVLAAETMKLYREQKVNPFSSCLIVLIQLPFLIAVYQAFSHGLSGQDYSTLLYSFIAKPETLNNMFLGMNLANPQIILAVLAGAAQFWQGKMLIHNKPTGVVVKKDEGTADESTMVAMNKQMMYLMPILTVFIGWKLPGGLALYWLVTTVLTGLQQMYFFRQEKSNVSDGSVD